MTCHWTVWDVTENGEVVFATEPVFVPCSDPATRATNHPLVPTLCAHHAGTWDRSIAPLPGSKGPTSALSEATSCGGWEVVCPDGRVRHYPFHNHGDAESTAKLATQRRCRLWPKPSKLETSQPPCPEGQHEIRAITEMHCREPRSID